MEMAKQPVNGSDVRSILRDSPEERILLDSHEERLQRVEVGMGEMSTTLARVDQNVEHIMARLEAMNEGLHEVKAAANADRTKDVEVQMRIKSLEEDMKERSEHRKDVRKWLFGIASAVIIAALLMVLGLKG